MGTGFEEFIVKLSCYDFRVDNLGLAPSIRHRYIDSLRRDSSLHKLHLKHLKPLGIGTVYGVKRVEPSLWRQLRRLSSISNELLERKGFPLPWYIHTVSVLNSRRLFVSWFTPPGVPYGEALDWLDEGYHGYKIPVQNCIGRLDPRLVDRLAEHLDRLLGVSELETRTPVLAYVLVAVLDHDPLLTLKKLGDIVNVASSRDLPALLQGSIKLRYVNRYYRRLSSHYVLGRVYVSRTPLPGIRALISVDKSCSRTLYGALAATRGSTYLYYSGAVSVAGVSMTRELVDALMDRECDLGIYVRYRTVVFPFPYELYDPLEARWRDKPSPEYTMLLKRLGLVQTRR